MAALSGSEIAAGFAPVADQARDQLCSQGLPAERVRLSHVLDVRFRGQSSERPIDVDEPAHADVVQLVDKRFRRAHEQAYGNAADDGEIELVNWKVSATVTMPRANRTPVVAAPTRAATPVREQAVRYVDAAGAISTHDRDDLRVEHPVRGPTVITEMDATIFVPPAFMATVNVSGNLHLVRRDASGENP